MNKISFKRNIQGTTTTKKALRKKKSKSEKYSVKQGEEKTEDIFQREEKRGH